eukprot:6470006-Amphidinium_carterae.1
MARHSAELIHRHSLEVQSLSAHSLQLAQAKVVVTRSVKGQYCRVRMIQSMPNLFRSSGMINCVMNAMSFTGGCITEVVSNQHSLSPRIVRSIKMLSCQKVRNAHDGTKCLRVFPTYGENSNGPAIQKSANMDLWRSGVTASCWRALSKTCKKNQTPKRHLVSAYCCFQCLPLLDCYFNGKTEESLRRPDGPAFTPEL